jgi:hypothetical protein
VILLGNVGRALALVLMLAVIVLSLVTMSGHIAGMRAGGRRRRSGHIVKVAASHIGLQVVLVCVQLSRWGRPPQPLMPFTLVFMTLTLWALADLILYQHSSKTTGEITQRPSLSDLPAKVRSRGELLVTWAMATASLAIVGVVILSLIVFAVPGKKPFDPLRLTTPQIVLNRVPGVEGPAVGGGEDLHVIVTKCNVSGKEVGVSGHSVWRTADPAGSFVEGTSGTAIRPATPRCVTKEFVNPIPEAVLARTRDLLAGGVRRVTWQLAGVDTPLHPTGVERAWTTEAFVMVP